MNVLITLLVFLCGMILSGCNSEVSNQKTKITNNNQPLCSDFDGIFLDSNDLNIPEKYTGIVKDCEENGKVSYVGFYKNGLKDSTHTCYFESGLIQSIERFEDGVFHGTQSYFFENGNKLLEVPYRNGLQQGVTKKWYENGQIEVETSFDKGKSDGSIDRGWYENGQLKHEFGKHYYDNGQLRSFDNKTWYKNGQIKSELSSNEYKCWDQNGEELDTEECQLIEITSQMVNATLLLRELHSLSEQDWRNAFDHSSDLCQRFTIILIDKLKNEIIEIDSVNDILDNYQIHDMQYFENLNFKSKMEIGEILGALITD
jgi:antitoxin component YwqK of YwqJK toxin-antitoxin module